MAVRPQNGSSRSRGNGSRTFSQTWTGGVAPPVLGLPGLAEADELWTWAWRPRQAWLAYTPASALWLAANVLVSLRFPSGCTRQILDFVLEDPVAMSTLLLSTIVMWLIIGSRHARPQRDRSRSVRTLTVSHDRNGGADEPRPVVGRRSAGSGSWAEFVRPLEVDREVCSREHGEMACSGGHRRLCGWRASALLPGQTGSVQRVYRTPHDVLDRPSG